MKTYIVSSVRVIIHATEERRSRDLAYILDHRMAFTRLLVREVVQVVDKTGREHKGSLAGLLLSQLITGMSM
jgi:hypothetical protein